MKRFTSQNAQAVLIVGLVLGGLWLVNGADTLTGGQESVPGEDVAGSPETGRPSLADESLAAVPGTEAGGQRSSSTVPDSGTNSSGDERPEVIMIDHVEHRVEWEGDVRRVYQLDGTLHSESTWINGKRDGVSTSWHENGVVGGVTTWVEGQREGEATYFSRTGAPIVVGAYKGGFRYGLWEEFDSKSGLMIQRGEYALAGKETGVWTNWDRDGNLESRGSFINGRKNGSWEYWLKNGDLHMRGDYLDGKKSGFWQVFAYGDVVDENATGFYENGNKVD